MSKSRIPLFRVFLEIYVLKAGAAVIVNNTKTF